MYAIIFTRTKVDAHDISRKLQKDGIDCDALHGDLSQAQRDDVMSRFRAKILKVLVATDVAARGLDVDNLTHVINYNLPDDVESYTHRSGRTGRAGREGISVSIINSRERGKIRRIEKMLRRPFAYCKVPGGEDVCRAQFLYYAGKVAVTEPKENMERFSDELFSMFGELDKETLIRKVFSYEFGKILKKYNNAPDLNLPEERHEKKEGGKRDSRFTVFSINVGRKDGFSPRSLMEIINYCAPRKGMDVGGIQLSDTMTRFEIDLDGIKNFPRYFKGMAFESTPLKVVPLDEPGGFVRRRDGEYRRDGGRRRGNTAQNKFGRAQVSGNRRRERAVKRGQHD